MLPQPVTGLIAALIILGLVLFIAPPAARLWIAALVLVIALAARGKGAAAIIDNLRRTLYGR
jgi:hypothetical protein